MVVYLVCVFFLSVVAPCACCKICEFYYSYFTTAASFLLKLHIVCNRIGFIEVLKYPDLHLDHRHLCRPPSPDRRR